MIGGRTSVDRLRPNRRAGTTTLGPKQHGHTGGTAINSANPQRRRDRRHGRQQHRTIQRSDQCSILHAGPEALPSLHRSGGARIRPATNVALAAAGNIDRFRRCRRSNLVLNGTISGSGFGLHLSAPGSRPGTLTLGADGDLQWSDRRQCRHAGSGPCRVDKQHPPNSPTISVAANATLDGSGLSGGGILFGFCCHPTKSQWRRHGAAAPPARVPRRSNPAARYRPASAR